MWVALSGVTVVPLGLMIWVGCNWDAYDRWAKKNPEAHKERVREYIKTGRSIYDKPWG